MLNRTVTEQLVHALREEIIQGRLRPGQSLRQEDLAERFRVSTMPIREALRELEAAGLVVIYPHRGAVVTRLSPDDLTDLYDVRTALEVMAIQFAVPNLTPEIISDLESVLDEMDRHVENVLSMVNLNHRFHTTIYAASGRKHLCELLQVLRHRTEHYLYTYIACLGYMPQAQTEHRAILDACRRREVDRAAELTHQHLNHVAQAVVRYVTETGAASSDVR